MITPPLNSMALIPDVHDPTYAVRVHIEDVKILVGYYKDGNACFLDYEDYH